MAGNIGHKDAKMFKTMLLLDVIRGMDSTGVAAVEYGVNSKVLVEKEIGLPDNLWSWGTSEIFNASGVPRVTYRTLIGHNRAATIGKVNAENAHPFEYGAITGAHNGTLTDWADLEGYREIDVDSKALFKTIDEKGIDHAWKSFRGAAAITYWNDDEQTLNIVRNSQRPLFFARSKDGKNLYWASESFMLFVAAAKAGVDLQENEKGQSVFQFLEDTLYTFKPTMMEAPLKEKRTLEKKKYATTNYTQTRSGGVTTYTSTGNSKKKSHRVKPTKINKGWAAGLQKGEKSVRGAEAELKGVTERTVKGEKRYIAILELPDGEMLEVYCDTLSEYRAWESRSTQPGIMYYKLGFRPRMFMNPLTGDFECYRVSNKGMRLSRTVYRKNQPTENESNVVKLYDGPSGKVTKTQWELAVSMLSPTCSCSNCLNPLNIEEHEDIFWAGVREAYCPECSSNAGIMTQIYYERKI